VTAVVEAGNGRILTGLESTDNDTRRTERTMLWRISSLCGGSFAFTPGHSRAQNSVVNLLSPPPSVLSGPIPANGDLDFGRTAANIPHVARYRNNPKSVAGVDCGPWRAAVSGGPE